MSACLNYVFALHKEVRDITGYIRPEPDIFTLRLLRYNACAENLRDGQVCLHVCVCKPGTCGSTPTRERFRGNEEGAVDSGQRLSAWMAKDIMPCASMSYTEEGAT